MSGKVISLSALYCEKEGIGRFEKVNQSSDEGVIWYRVCSDDILGDIAWDELSELHQGDPDVLEKLNNLSRVNHKSRSIDNRLESEGLDEVTASKECADRLIALAKKWYSENGFPDLEFKVYFFNSLSDVEQWDTDKAILIS